MPKPDPNLDAIFCEAIELRSAEARADYLAGACDGDDDLRRQVESLLAAHFRAGGFLDRPDAAPARPAVGPDAPDTMIGPYRLLERIGEGGMGVVYVAEQTAPVRRRVALKVVKPGMDTREVVARFEAERQALALMDHPNIAQVFDGGTLAEEVLHAGRPYFVMELVRGLPITDYCDQAGLAPRERLKLFAQVCRAVQHAHQKGVIHRDLKPSNVLVTLHDGEPVPKVIDFGVAKAVGQRLTERSLYTRFTQLIGTPLYMAPEQAELSGLDVDTRADVYALGVLLYELLTGTTPFDRETLGRAGLDEVRRIIREEEPTRPSRRVSTLGAPERSTVSGRRGLDERRLVHLLRGDLDWVAMKALEKDRNRRYESAGAFAADVERYLADEPVEAGPPSAWYRLRKAARRNRAALVSAGLVAAALVAGTAVSTWQAVRARTAQHQAEAERDRAAAAEQRALAISNFLQRDLLRQVDGDRQIEDGFAANPELTVKEALHRAAATIGERFRDEPLVEAALRRTIGQAYRGVGGDERQAAAHLERAVALYQAHLGPDHAETLACQHALALSYQFLGRLPDAIAMLEQILDRQRASLGPDHRKSLITLNSLGEACRKAGQYDRARRLIEQALARKTATFGADHAMTVESLHDLGLVLRDLGRFPEAIARLEEATAKLESVYGPDHGVTRYSLSNLIDVCERAGQIDRANALLRQAIRRARDGGRALAPLAELRARLGQNLLKQHQPVEAEAALRESLANDGKAAGRQPMRFFTLSLLGEALLGQQRYAEAEPLLLQGYEGMKPREAPWPAAGKTRLAEAAERLVRLYEATGQPEKARAVRERLSAGKVP